MLKRFSWVFVLGLVLLVPMTVLATTLTHAAAKVEIAVPEGFKSSQEGDVISISSPDDAMHVVFRVVDGDKADKVFEEVDKAVESQVGEITWGNDGKYTEVDVNGMDGYEYYGTAAKGKLSVYCMSIDVPSDKTLLLYWFSDEATDKKYEKETDFILKGIKPLKK